MAAALDAPLDHRARRISVGVKAAVEMVGVCGAPGAAAANGGSGSWGGAAYRWAQSDVNASRAGTWTPSTVNEEGTPPSPSRWLGASTPSSDSAATAPLSCL